MKPLNCYAIKNPKGEIILSTILENKEGCILYFDNVMSDPELSWSELEEQGYSCVPCTVSEVREESDILKHLATSLTDYTNKKHSQEECSGFIDGFEKACQLIHSLNNGNND